jgi:hypothetical protein
VHLAVRKLEFLFFDPVIEFSDKDRSIAEIQACN